MGWNSDTRGLYQSSEKWKGGGAMDTNDLLHYEQC